MELVEGPSLAAMIGPPRRRHCARAAWRAAGAGALGRARERASSTATSSPRTSSSATMATSRCSTSGWRAWRRRPPSPRADAETQSRPLLLGTPRYMSPEQARGETRDRRERRVLARRRALRAGDRRAPVRVRVDARRRCTRSRRPRCRARSVGCRACRRRSSGCCCGRSTRWRQRGRPRWRSRRSW